MCARLLFTVVVLAPALGCSSTGILEGIDEPSADVDEELFPIGSQARTCGSSSVCNTDPHGTEQQCAACAELEYAACSCAAADPCGWRNDGNCDDFCGALFPDAHFDDSADCQVDHSGDACAECVTYEYSACSCSAANPCRWQKDHSCDAYCVETFPDDHFDDSADCRRQD